MKLSSKSSSIISRRPKFVKIITDLNIPEYKAFCTTTSSSTTTIEGKKGLKRNRCEGGDRSSRKKRRTVTCVTFL